MGKAWVSQVSAYYLWLILFSFFVFIATEAEEVEKKKPKKNKKGLSMCSSFDWIFIRGKDLVANIYSEAVKLCVLPNIPFNFIYLPFNFIYFYHKSAKQNCFNFIKCLDTTVNFINFLLVFVSIYEYMLANNGAGFALLCMGYVSQATVIFSLQPRKRRTANLQVRLCGWLNENNYRFTRNFTCQLDYLYFYFLTYDR